MNKSIPRPRLISAEKIRSDRRVGPRQTLKTSLRSIDGLDRLITGIANCF